ncbi:MAG: hypothetical protein HY842_08435 [Bacteroidetes bacterium]|nr:hypothetical protein [Bacteroidota bacterium]
MKKNALLLTIFASLLLLNFQCGKCDDIDCFTPPNEFTFQLLDKDSGEDLVANGTFQADEISVFSITGNKKHELQFLTDSTAYFFTDQEIGWETGPENTSYELRLNPSTTLPFTYETREVSEDCCTFFELARFEMDSVERFFIPQQNLFQMRI